MLGEEYKEYCKNFKIAWNYIKQNSKDMSIIVDEICQLRLYFNSKDRWMNLFSEVEVAFVSKETCDYSKLDNPVFKDLGLFSEEGHFLMNERYIIPIRDMLGNIIALVGWYPDRKKYITTPSKFFSKSCLFFGMEQLGKTGIGKDYYIVEGIFDALSLRALGFNAVAHMGISDSKVKQILYGLFRRLGGIPDNDTQGRRVLKNDAWNLPSNAFYLRWVGSLDYSDEGEKIEIKDIDKLCSLFEESSVISILKTCMENKNNRIVKIDLA